MTALLLIIPFFLVLVVIHAIVCRMPLPGSSVMSFVGIGGSAGAVFAYLLYRRFGFAPEMIAALLVYALVCELYIFCFTMTIGSISANLLVALSRRDMTLAEIEPLYDSRTMVRKRIERLVSAGLLTASGGVLIPTGKGEQLSRYFAAFSGFFRHPPQNSN